MVGVGKRGKAPTKQEKSDYEQWSKERTKIANMVARKPELEKICCVCGKPGNILHNREDPYYITFICDECRKDPQKLTLAEERRFDIRTKLNVGTMNVTTYTDEMVKRTVLEYMNENYLMSMGDYCKKRGISRHQFNQLLDRYDKIFPGQRIHELVKIRSKTVQRQKILKSKEDKKLLVEKK